MRKSFHELTARDLPASTSFERDCHIIMRKGEFWKDLPGEPLIGWNSEGGTISILDPFEISPYDPETDPPSFRAFVDAVARPGVQQKRLVDANLALRRGENQAALSGYQSLYESIKNKFIRDVRLDFSATHFTYPDPRIHLVRVRMAHSRRIDPATDVGTLIPKPRTQQRLRVDQIHPSADERLSVDL